MPETQSSHLEDLKGLTATQFNELLFRLRELAPPSVLPPPSGTQTDRAIELLRYLESQDALQALGRVLEQFKWNGAFVPNGCHTVGKGLLGHEEAREQKLMDQARERGLNPEQYRTTPRAFFTLQRQAAWLGVFRDWDVPSRPYKSLFLWAMQCAPTTRDPKVAVIHGAGGTGKSVMLRRLAVDLSRFGKDVVWVKYPDAFFASETGDNDAWWAKPRFLMVDNLQVLTDGQARTLLALLDRYPTLAVAAAGRGVPDPIAARLSPDQVYAPPEPSDILRILQRAGELVPEWRSTTDQVIKGPVQNARLIWLLTRLAKQEGDRAPEDTLGADLTETLLYDLDHISEMMPGLADALLDAASLQLARCALSKETFIGLVVLHQPTSQAEVLLSKISGNARWNAIRTLVQYDPKDDTIVYHHDELCKSLLQAATRRPKWTGAGDDVWCKAALDRVFKVGSMSSKSRALEAVVTAYPGLLSQSEVCDRIHKLIQERNTHRTYGALLGNPEVGLDTKHRSALLLEMASTLPNMFLSARVSRGLQGIDDADLTRIRSALRAAGVKDPVVVRAMHRVGLHDQAFSLVADRMSDPSMPPEVAAPYLTRLGDAARAHAVRLLKASPNPGVVGICLKVLKEEAPQYALDILAKKPLRRELAEVAFGYLPRERAIREAKRILQTGSADLAVCECCLDLLEDRSSDRIGAAKRILSRTTVAPVLAARCLRILRADDRAAAESMARTLLHRKRQDPLVARLSLEVLGPSAKPEATALLKKSDLPASLQRACLKLLGVEAETYARRLLARGKLDPDVAALCLDYAGASATTLALHLLASAPQPRSLQEHSLELLSRHAKDLDQGQRRRLQAFATATDDPEFFVRCHMLLGGQAAAVGEQLLARASARPSIAPKCLALLDDRRLQEGLARVILANPGQVDADVLGHCLRQYPRLPEARDAAQWVLSDNWDSAPELVKAAALRAFTGTPIRLQRAREVLERWERNRRRLVTAALGAFWDEPKTVATTCLDIVSRWREEVESPSGKVHKYVGHLQKALRNPEIAEVSKFIAQEMLDAEAEKVGLLEGHLKSDAHLIAEGGSLPWAMGAPYGNPWGDDSKAQPVG